MWCGVVWCGVKWIGVVWWDWCGVVWCKYVQVMAKGMLSVSSLFASYDMLNKSLFDKNNKSYNYDNYKNESHSTQNDTVSTQLCASPLLKYGASQGVMNHMNV